MKSGYDRLLQSFIQSLDDKHKVEEMREAQKELEAKTPIGFVKHHPGYAALAVSFVTAIWSIWAESDKLGGTAGVFLLLAVFFGIKRIVEEEF